MPEDISGKIGLDTTEWKTGVAQLNQDVRVIESGFKAVAAGMDDWRKSADGLRERNNALTEIIDKQKDKVSLLEGEYQRMKDAAAESGDNTEKTASALQDFEIKLNRAREELAKNETELRKNSDALTEIRQSGGDGIFAKIAESIKPSKENMKAFAGSVVDAAKALGTQLLNAAKSVTSAVGTALVGALKGAVAGAAALGAAAGALAVKIGKEVISAFGELEQNLGGSEAVFGEYAKSIQKSGEEAYKNLGVSQSEYLSTANKMGALFQGSGVEQQKSLELTEKAMQRAADMASVMGIETSAALEAVTGAAKGNFSMMDNLGVAMNATSIEAYALSKGLDFAWDSASNAEKAEVAMQMFFENTEQYAGNFARESTETISGSIGLLQASTSSFMAGLGNVGADMTNLTQNVIDAFLSMVDNIIPVLESIVTHIPTAFAALAPALAEVLPILIDAATGLFSSILDTLVGLLPQLIPVAIQAIMMIASALIENIPQILDAAMQLIMGLVNGILEAMPMLVQAATQIIKTLGQFLIENLPALLDAAMQIIQQLIDGIIDLLPELIPMAIQIMVQIAMALIQGIPEIIARLPEIVSAIIEGFAAVNWGEIGINLLNGVVDGMKSIVSSVGEAVKNIFKGIWDGVKSFFGIRSPSTVAAEDGKQIMEGFQKGTEDAQPSALSKIKSVFTGIWDGIKSIFGFGGGNESAEAKKTGQDVTKAIGEGITSGGASAQTNVKDLSKTLIDLFKQELGVSGGGSTKTKPFGENIAKGLPDGWNAQSSALQADGKKLATTIIDALGDAFGAKSGPSTITKPFGERVTQGIAEGIKALLSQASNEAKTVALGILNALSSALGTSGGSSTVTNTYGRGMAQGIIDGIKSMASSLAEAATTIGSQIASGIAQGIKNGASTITSAAKSAADSALSSAKSQLGIKSPSKVAADQVGLPYIQGIAEGIRQNIGLLQTEMQGVSENLAADMSVEPISVPAIANAGGLTIVSAALQLREKVFGDLVVELADAGQGFASSNRERFDLGVQLA